MMLLYLCMVIITLHCIKAQFGGQKEDKGKILKKDLPLIACDVCQMMISSVYDEVLDIRENAPYKKIDEEQVHDELDAICKPKDKKGTWIRELDIIENDDRTLSLIIPDEGGYSKCEHECNEVLPTISLYHSMANKLTRRVIYNNKYQNI